MAIRKVGKMMIAPLNPPMSPIIEKKVYALLSYMYLFFDNYILIDKSSLSVEFLVILIYSSTVTKLVTSGSLDKKPMKSLLSLNSF